MNAIVQRRAPGALAGQAPTAPQAAAALLSEPSAAFKQALAAARGHMNDVQRPVRADDPLDYGTGPAVAVQVPVAPPTGPEGARALAEARDRLEWARAALEPADEARVRKWLLTLAAAGLPYTPAGDKLDDAVDAMAMWLVGMDGLPAGCFTNDTLKIARDEGMREGRWPGAAQVKAWVADARKARLERRRDEAVEVELLLVGAEGAT